jgi:hypothetical protein
VQSEQTEPENDTRKVPLHCVALLKLPVSEYVVLQPAKSVLATVNEPPGQSGMPGPIIAGTPVEPLTPSVLLPRFEKFQVDTLKATAPKAQV